jgi:hypothetical protein
MDTFAYVHSHGTSESLEAVLVAIGGENVLYFRRIPLVLMSYRHVMAQPEAADYGATVANQFKWFMAHGCVGHVYDTLQNGGREQPREASPEM